MPQGLSPHPQAPPAAAAPGPSPRSRCCSSTPWPGSGRALRRRRGGTASVRSPSGHMTRGCNQQATTRPHDYPFPEPLPCRGCRRNPDFRARPQHVIISNEREGAPCMTRRETRDAKKGRGGSHDFSLFSVPELSFFSLGHRGFGVSGRVVAWPQGYLCGP